MTGPKLPRVWRCPECGEALELNEPTTVNRHHDWHRLVERQRAERPRYERDERER